MSVSPPASARIYYDGGCGLCHRFVRFVLGRDRGGWFRLAPLAGETFAARVPPERRAGLPDSVVVDPGDGTLLVRTDAVIAVLARLPAPWPFAGRLLAAVPRRLRDAAYDGVASIRRRLFAPPVDLCPTPDSETRGRFDP